MSDYTIEIHIRNKNAINFDYTLQTLDEARKLAYSNENLNILMMNRDALVCIYKDNIRVGLCEVVRYENYYYPLYLSYSKSNTRRFLINPNTGRVVKEPYKFYLVDKKDYVSPEQLDKIYKVFKPKKKSNKRK